MIKAVQYALLLGEMEGVFAQLKQIGDDLSEVEYVETMKKKVRRDADYKQAYKNLRNV